MFHLTILEGRNRSSPSNDALQIMYGVNYCLRKPRRQVSSCFDLFYFYSLLLSLVSYLQLTCTRCHIYPTPTLFSLCPSIARGQGHAGKFLFLVSDIPGLSGTNENEPLIPNYNPTYCLIASLIFIGVFLVKLIGILLKHDLLRHGQTSSDRQSNHVVDTAVDFLG